MSGQRPLRVALLPRQVSGTWHMLWADLLQRTSIPLELLHPEGAEVVIQERGSVEPPPPGLPCLHVPAPAPAKTREELVEAFGYCRPLAVQWGGFPELEDTREFGLSADLPGICHALLHGAEEAWTSVRDAHGRFPPEESLLVREDVIDVPVADRLGRALGFILWRLSGRREPPPAPPWFLCATLDIDSAGMYRGRALARNMREIWRTAPGRTPRALVQAAMVTTRLEQDPHLGLRELAEALEGMAIPATFFCQTHRRHRLDSYRLARSPGLVTRLRRILANEFHHVGLHGSYATRDLGGGFLRAQWSMLRGLLGPGITPVHRAHYLREPAGAPIRGRSVDSTLGHGAREGFRRGTAFPFRLREAAGHEGTPAILEAPPTLMDSTLRHFRGMTPEDAFDTGRELMLRVRETGGLFVPVWHPHNMEELLWPGWGDVLFDLLREAQRLGARPLPLALAAEALDDRLMTIRESLRRLHSP